MALIGGSILRSRGKRPAGCTFHMQWLIPASRGENRPCTGPARPVMGSSTTRGKRSGWPCPVARGRPISRLTRENHGPPRRVRRRWLIRRLTGRPSATIRRPAGSSSLTRENLSHHAHQSETGYSPRGENLDRACTRWLSLRSRAGETSHIRGGVAHLSSRGENSRSPW